MPTEPRLALFLCALVVCGATRAASAEGARSAASPERFGSDLLEDEARGTTAMDDVTEVSSSRRARRRATTTTTRNTATGHRRRRSRSVIDPVGCRSNPRGRRRSRLGEGGLPLPECRAAGAGSLTKT